MRTPSNSLLLYSMHTHTHTHIHTYIHAYIHACMHTYMPSLIIAPRRPFVHTLLPATSLHIPAPLSLLLNPHPPPRRVSSEQKAHASQPPLAADVAVHDVLFSGQDIVTQERDDALRVMRRVLGGWWRAVFSPCRVSLRPFASSWSRRHLAVRPGTDISTGAHWSILLPRTDNNTGTDISTTMPTGTFAAVAVLPEPTLTLPSPRPYNWSE